MLSRHRFCCYMCFPNALVLREWVRVTHFTHYPIYNFSIYWLFLSTKCIGLHGVVDVLVDFVPRCSKLGNRMIFFFFFFRYFLCCFFFVIIITVQICKFNITVSTQILLLYYPLWCPGLQRLQRSDFWIGIVACIDMLRGKYWRSKTHHIYHKYWNKKISEQTV